MVYRGGLIMETNYFMDIEGFEEYWGYEPIEGDDYE